MTGHDNGRAIYEVAAGMSMQETAELKRILSTQNNRTLTCNGSHLPHVAVSGLDLSGLARPVEVSDELVAFCTAPRSAAGRAGGEAAPVAG